MSDPPDCGPTGETIDRKAEKQFDVEKKCKLLGAGASEKYFTRAKCFFIKTNKDEECVVPTTTELNQNNNYAIKILGAPQSKCHLIVKDN